MNFVFIFKVQVISRWLYSILVNMNRTHLLMAHVPTDVVRWLFYTASQAKLVIYKENLKLGKGCFLRSSERRSRRNNQRRLRGSGAWATRAEEAPGRSEEEPLAPSPARRPDLFSLPALEVRRLPSNFTIEVIIWIYRIRNGQCFVYWYEVVNS